MTLSRKFIFWIVVLVGGVLSLGVLSIWNLASLYHTATGAAAEYEAMDRADAVVPQIAWLHDALSGANAGNVRDVRFFTPIQVEISRIITELSLAAAIEDGDGDAELLLARSAAERFDAAFNQFTGGSAPADNKTGVSIAVLNASAVDLEKARVALADVSKMIPDSARRHVIGAADRLHSRLLWTIAWLIVVLCVSGLIHATQYRALVRPLIWLREDMKDSASTGYRELVRPRGDAEFQRLAGYFNGLAKELAELYRGLEAKVISRSRELVRSERLASVGFLAAGVAHEINNPLSVISGYAELAAKGLKSVLAGDGDGASEVEAAAEAEALAAALDAQQIIRDEAFRCKEITGRLLSLARGGADAREPVRLDELAQQVSVLTRGLRNYRDRRVTLDFSAAESLDVVANAVEMKQVLLNLTVNALEAVAPGAGEVRIGGQRSGDWVELSVQDNGRGMSAETLDQIFEPFFTAKRGAGEPGTGLGLSITHAIVENHGGRIRAESAGVGRGSRFVVRMPFSRPAIAAVSV